MPAQRSVFFVSDRTGVTAEALGYSLLTQFGGVQFVKKTLPFIDTPEKARQAVTTINRAAGEDGARPLVFATLVRPEIGEIVGEANALYLDCFHVFVSRIEAELGGRALHAAGLPHRNALDTHRRIEAVNFALAHDDGAMQRLADADIVIVGVSRSGKTPTCLYLALQYGVRAANYPLTPEDFHIMRLPQNLQGLRGKLYGLTIQPERLHEIRQARKPDSRYAELANCRSEVRAAETLMRDAGIPCLDVTGKSVEEIAATVLHRANPPLRGE